MKNIPAITLAVLALLPAVLWGQEAAPAGGAAPALSVTRIAVCTGIENREPVGEATSFDSGVGQLSCFTKVEGAQGETSIFHVWFHEGVERARIELSVKAASWRTWSRKNITAEGAWKVEVQDAQGGVLSSVEFTVTAQAVAQ
jgi:hypothetical protein